MNVTNRHILNVLSFSWMTSSIDHPGNLWKIGTAALGLWILLLHPARAALEYGGTGVYPQDPLFIGYGGNGTMILNHLTTPNATTSLSVTGNAYLGSLAGGSGTVTIDGAGAVWTIGGLLQNGLEGDGAIYVKNGGEIKVNGTGTSSFGTSLTMLSVLDISGGGKYTAAGGIQTKTAIISVDGADSTLTVGGMLLAFAPSGTGSLTITNGAKAKFGSLGISMSGETTSTLTVDGATLEVTHGLQVGGVNSRAEVTGGAQVTTGAVFIDSSSSASTGEMVLSGTDTKWTTGSVTVGVSGNGSLTLKDGAELQSTIYLLLAGNNIDGITGSLHIGDGGAPGTLNVGLIQGGVNDYGEALVEFNHNASDYYFTRDTTALGTAIAIQGITRVEVTSGTTILNASNNLYSGGTIITGGTLVADSNAALGTGAVEVAGGELLIRNGRTVANTITLSGGSLSREIGSGTALASLSAYTGQISDGIATQARFLGGETSAVSTITGGFSHLSAALNDAGRVSDVFHLSGLPVDALTGETDTYVLQLKVDPSLMTGDSLLAWFNPQTDLWVNAVEGNFGGESHFVLGAYNAGNDFHLGTYGIDTENGVVWAVLNHHSDFAIVAIPEPSAWRLLGLSLLAVLVFRQQRRRDLRFIGQLRRD